MNHISEMLKSTSVWLLTILLELQRWGCTEGGIIKPHAAMFTRSVPLWCNCCSWQQRTTQALAGFWTWLTLVSWGFSCPYLELLAKWSIEMTTDRKSLISGSIGSIIYKQQTMELYHYIFLLLSTFLPIFELTCSYDTYKLYCFRSY